MDYPSELSPSAKATIEHALAEIELACIASGSNEYEMFIAGSGVARDPESRTKTKTITPMQMVIRGYDVAVDATTTDALTAGWTAETLTNVTDRLLDRIIRRIYKQHPRLGTLDEFTSRVYQTLRAQPFYAALQEAIRDLSSPTTAAIAAAVAPSTATPVTDLKAYRQTLLDEYKRVTGVMKNKPIYESRRSGIHKPAFYQWLRGELPATSQTAIKFERFLAEKRPPVIAK